MFTGIIEEIGIVRKVIPGTRGIKIIIEAKRIMEDCKIEDSIAVNGVCLTVTDVTKVYFTVNAVSETLERSTLSVIKAGARVNLERALTLNKRLGGHIVQGHVDLTGRIINIKSDGESRIVEISNPDLSKEKYIVEKGSVTLNGVSLTIAGTGRGSFKVAVIPYTWDNTVFRYAKQGDRINIEFDIIAKYVEKMVSINPEKESSLTLDKLRSLGF
ncbi:riboflavin synthase [bacterium]|nr:riboflavin synthase [bacterium]